MAGLKSDAKTFFLCAFTYAIMRTTSISFHEACAQAAPNTGIATTVSVSILNFLSLFAGFIVPANSIPSYYKASAM